MHKCMCTSLSDVYTYKEKLALYLLLQAKPPEELESLVKEVTDLMETAASTADLGAARRHLVDGMGRLRDGLAASAPHHHGPDTGTAERESPDRWMQEILSSCLHLLCFPKAAVRCSVLPSGGGVGKPFDWRVGGGGVAVGSRV